MTTVHRVALRLVSNALRNESNDADSWIGGDELYMLLRWSLLRIDQRHHARHSCDADALYIALSEAYRRHGGYIALCRARSLFHSPTLRQTA